MRRARAEERGAVRVVGVMGHLGCADEPGDPANAAGRALFAWGVERRPGGRPAPAAAAPRGDRGDADRPGRGHHTMSRVGAGLVGIDP